MSHAELSPLKQITKSNKSEGNPRFIAEKTNINKILHHSFWTVELTLKIRLFSFAQRNSVNKRISDGSAHLDVIVSQSTS